MGLLTGKLKAKAEMEAVEQKLSAAEKIINEKLKETDLTGLMPLPSSHPTPLPRVSGPWILVRGRGRQASASLGIEEAIPHAVRKSPRVVA